MNASSYAAQPSSHAAQALRKAIASRIHACCKRRCGKYCKPRSLAVVQKRLLHIIMIMAVLKAWFNKFGVLKGKSVPCQQGVDVLQGTHVLHFFASNFHLKWSWEWAYQQGVLERQSRITVHEEKHCCHRRFAFSSSFNHVGSALRINFS